jgi:hypothetical protein
MSDQRAATPTRPSSPIASTNLTIKFLLELAALALLAYWGAVTGDGVVPVILAIASPALMIAIWGAFAAPRAARRLPAPARIPLELGIFAIACAAGYAAGAVIESTVFAVIAVLNAIGLTVFRQWAD